MKNFFEISIVELQKERAIFHSEDDLKLSLGFKIKELFPEFEIRHFKDLPIRNTLKNSNDSFAKVANKQLEQFSRFSKQQNNFTKYLSSQYQNLGLTKKIINWIDLDYSNFIKELNKAIKKSGGEKLSKPEEMDWMDIFESKKAEAQTLKSEIEKTDKEIDQMVYELYGLSEEEIKIVEEVV